VLDGKDGNLIARVSEDAGDDVAISPDGKLLAVTRQVTVSSTQVQPTVDIYEISGAKVARMTFKPVNVAGFGNAAAMLGAQFISGGNRLLISGPNDTMIRTIK
jgi:hypothetical protein